MALTPGTCANCGGGGGGGGGPTGFSSATVNDVPSNIAATTLATSNGSRRRLYIFNDSSSVLRIKLGAGVSEADFSFYIPSQGSLELEFPAYTGIVTGIWETADGVAQVTEVTA